MQIDIFGEPRQIIDLWREMYQSCMILTYFRICFSSIAFDAKLSNFSSKYCGIR